MDIILLVNSDSKSMDKEIIISNYKMIIYVNAHIKIKFVYHRNMIVVVIKILLNVIIQRLEEWLY